MDDTTLSSVAEISFACVHVYTHAWTSVYVCARACEFLGVSVSKAEVVAVLCCVTTDMCKHFCVGLQWMPFESDTAGASNTHRSTKAHTHKIHKNKIIDAHITLHHHVWEYTVMQTCTSEDTQTLNKPLVSLSALTVLENTQMHAQAHMWRAAAIKCYSQNRRVKKQFSWFLLTSLATCKHWAFSFWKHNKRASD